jgi:hypothetical protein
MLAFSGKAADNDCRAPVRLARTCHRSSRLRLRREQTEATDGERPDVVGLAADRGIQRVRAAGLCPEPRLADTIGSPPYATIAFVTPVAGVRVPSGTVVLVDIAPGSQDANIFRSKAADRRRPWIEISAQQALESARKQSSQRVGPEDQRDHK